MLNPDAVKKLIWLLSTIAIGTTQLIVRPPITIADVPDNVIGFTGLKNSETVFLSAAAPIGTNLISC